MQKRARLIDLAAVAGALVCVGCGDDDAGSGGASTTSSTSAGPGTTSSTSDATSSSSTGGPITTDFVAGGDRPVDVELPAAYDPATPTPLLILLHGYTANGSRQNTYFQMSAVAKARGLIFAHPDGTTDPAGDQFWNATDACCDFYGSDVDDVGYLLGLVDEIASKVNVDPKRVYFVGHSNGGFMSYRLACEASGRIAAIASLAGAGFVDPADCGATAPLSVLQIHGTMDEVVAYEGGMFTVAYPSAAETTGYFAGVAGCTSPPVASGAPLDIDATLPGDETTVDAYPGCDAGYGVELWTIVGGSHVPTLAPGFSEKVIDFLLAHPKP